MITYSSVEKQAIADLVLADFAASIYKESGQKYAQSIGMDKADISNIKNSDKWNLIGPAKWVKLARHVNFQRGAQAAWVSADTSVKRYLFMQLDMCKNEGLTGIMVDSAGIGKTHAAKVYANQYEEAYYIDCSIIPSKAAFIRGLGKAVGVGGEGKLNEIIENVIFVLRQTDKPILVFDEAGDLEHAALLILKRLYNALEGVCGMYMIGADGLKSKLQRGISNKKLGFVEIFSRFGKKFSSALPEKLDDRVKYLSSMAREIAITNGVSEEADLQRIYTGLTSDGVGDMRKVQRMILGIKKNK